MFKQKSLAATAVSMFLCAPIGSQANNISVGEFASGIEGQHSFQRFLGAASEPALGAAYSVTGDLGTGELSLKEISERRTRTADSVWKNQNGLSQNATNLIDTISAIANEGLDPDAYYHQQLQNIRRTDIEKLDDKKFNQLFENAFLALTTDLAQGAVDPLKAQKEWHRPAQGADAKSLLEELQQGLIDFQQAMDLARPQHPMYEGQIKSLRTYREKDASRQVFVEDGEKLQIGDDAARVTSLKQALQELGDLAVDSDVDTIFDETLKQAVVSFQERHGLEPDGIVSQATLKALNVPYATRITQLQANLERWRWMPARLEDTHILVNLPEYRLRMNNAGTQIFEMPVVVGKPKHQTPIFSETMKHVVFAPTWTVPSSITNDELIPLEKRKPGYLKSEEIDFFRWTDNGLKRVPRSSVTRETLNRRPFPYMLRQRAGDKNVLGKVKFLMPNKHAIYLHDTQAKKLFGKAKRAFSHGCIRLGDPDLMAYVIMQMDGHKQSEISTLMEATTTTKVDLETHIPVHLAYFTAWQDENGRTHFREDIYKQDQRLDKALRAQSRKDVRFAKRTRSESLLAKVAQ